jgi:hypothetical protein
LASVIPTPTPIAAEPPVADPFPFDFAAAVWSEETISAPTTDAFVTDADAWTFVIVTATAAAIAIGPLLVAAEGVPVPPEPAPPFAPATRSALLRSPATCPSTPPAGAPLDVPPADEVAVPLVEDEPVAVTDAEPPTESARAFDAVTVWLATVSASETPTAAPDAAADPDAVVVAEATCVASSVRFPPMLVAPPVPIFASVVTVENEMATDGAIEAPPPDAPVVETVVIV